MPKKGYNMRLTLTIDMDGAAFEDDGHPASCEASRILTETAQKIFGVQWEGKDSHAYDRKIILFDINGNAVGKVEVT